MDKQGFWYLASPYSKFPLGLDRAWYNVNIAAGMLIKEGLSIFCPITQSHPIAVQNGIDPYDHKIWLPADKPIMDAAYGMIVLKLKGWDESVGIKFELEEFTKACKPIVYMKPYYIPSELRGGKYDPDAGD